MRLSISEAAKQAGYKDTSALRHAIKNGFLKSQKPSERVTLIDSEELDRWIAEGKPIWKKLKKEVDTITIT